MCICQVCRHPAVEAAEGGYLCSICTEGGASAGWRACSTLGQVSVVGGHWSSGCGQRRPAAECMWGPWAEEVVQGLRIPSCLCVLVSASLWQSWCESGDPGDLLAAGSEGCPGLLGRPRHGWIPVPHRGQVPGGTSGFYLLVLFSAASPGLAMHCPILGVVAKWNHMLPVCS